MTLRCMNRTKNTSISQCSILLSYDILCTCNYAITIIIIVYQQQTTAFYYLTLKDIHFMVNIYRFCTEN